MEQITAVCLLIAACVFQTVDGYDKYCSEKYPDRDGLMCYPNCRSGYAGVGPVCWGNCPSNTKDIGIVCTKRTYFRTTKLPRYCQSGLTKVGAVCLKTCGSGYDAVGPVCTEKCPGGYKDDGILCRRPLKLTGRSMKGCSIWKKATCSKKCGKSCSSGYQNKGCWCQRNLKIKTKRVIDRGSPKAMKCASSETQQIGLCYPGCRNGYSVVLNVCLAKCSGNTKDTGTQCQKKTYGRGLGKPLSCFNLPTCANFDTRCDPFYDAFKKAKGVGGKIAQSVCAGMYLLVRKQFEIIRTFSKCTGLNKWTVMSASLSVDASVGAAGVAEYGIAVDANSDEGICYVGYCYGVSSDAEAGGSINFGVWKSMDSIPGESKVIAGGVDFPGIELGIGGSAVFTDSSNEFIGIVGSAGLGVGVNPAQVSTYKCNTPAKLITKFKQPK